MKNHTAHGILIGLGLALAIILGGAAGFLLALVLGGIGAVIGAHLDGRINLRAVVDAARSSGRGGRG